LVDDVNLREDGTDSTKKNTETLIDASKKVGLEIDVRENYDKCMLLPRHQKAGQNRDIKIVNRPLENVAQFKY
jgi:hypothetical protein